MILWSRVSERTAATVAALGCKNFLGQSSNLHTRKGTYILDRAAKRPSRLSCPHHNIVRNTFLKPSLSILFLLPRFPPLHSGATISTLAFSTPAISASSIIFVYLTIGRIAYVVVWCKSVNYTDVDHILFCCFVEV